MKTNVDGGVDWIGKSANDIDYIMPGDDRTGTATNMTAVQQARYWEREAGRLGKKASRLEWVIIVISLVGLIVVFTAR